MWRCLDQHWQILTDKDNGIIGPDGQPLKVDSIVPGCPDGQLVAVIDSGWVVREHMQFSIGNHHRFTFSQVPRDISDQIYGRVQGAYYDTKQEFWMIPCQQSLNLTFSFGGQSYFVHPLDTVDNNFNQVDSVGQPICLGAVSALQPVDLIPELTWLVPTDYLRLLSSRTLRHDPGYEFP